jgi:hypothetical protein
VTNIYDYFIKIQRLIGNLPEVEVEKYEEQILTEKRGNLRIRLRFPDNSLLEISEAIQVIDNTLQRINYRYHYQSYAGNIIFRYDNAPHHSEVKTYPHHKHLFDKISESSHPDIETVIKEVKEHIMK